MSTKTCPGSAAFFVETDSAVNRGSALLRTHCLAANTAGCVRRDVGGCRALLVLAVAGWLLAVLVLYAVWGTISEVRFRAAVSPGHSEREVRLGAGPPDRVVEVGSPMTSGRLGDYAVSTRPVEKSVLLYYRFNHAVLVYIDKGGFVKTVYWARRRP
jgi:hypothetical protein